jgi:CHAT domain-containing protein/Tfp pilus assembly protein PilF
MARSVEIAPGEGNKRNILMFSVRSLICLFVFLFALISAADTVYAAKDEAERLWELGEKAYNAGRYHEALPYYNKSLSQCAGNLECVASNLNGIGAVYEALDDDRKAFKYYEDALAAARKANNRDLIATNLFNTGAIYHRTFNQYEKALSLFEESLKTFRELNDRKSAAIVLFNMGKTLNSLGRYDRSLSVLNESLKTNRELNDQQGIAGNMNLIGNVYASLGQYDKPLSYYQEALRINRRLNIQNETATTLRNIGDAYCDLVERDKAITYYQEALDIQKRHNLRFDMAITYTNIGALYKELDQYDKALSHYEESLKISRDLDNSAMIATNLNNTGNVYASLGKSDAALSYYQQSLKLDKQLNRPQRIAVTLNNIGMEYFRLGQYEKALYSLHDALEIEKKLNNPHNIAARLNNIGAVYLRQKRYREAEDVFLERKNTGRRITKTRLIHAGLVEVYLATKRYDEALALLKELPPNWRDNRNRRMEYHTQYGLALKGKGIFRESSLELLKAVSIVEEIRRSVVERSEFFAGGGYIGRLIPYRELMAVLSEMAIRREDQDDAFRPYGRDAASSAFYFAELTKARMFLEMMAGAVRKYEEPQIPSDIKNREAGIIKELSSIEKNRESTYTKGEAAFKRLSQKEEELVKQLDSLISDIRKHYPLYAAINYPKPIPAEDLPLKDNEVLIEFGVSNDAVVVFDVRKGGVNKIHNINISGEELAEKVKKFIEPLNSGRFSEFSARSAGILYDLLLSDAAKAVKDTTERLIIIPDGLLGLLPFEALVVKDGKDSGDSIYVGDKWTITYSQSATSLALTRLLKPSATGKSLFALGNPVYEKSDPRYIAYKQGKPEPVPAQNLRQYAYRGVTVLAKSGTTGDTMAWEDLIYPALPETEDEIREIARLFGLKPDPPDILLGVSATETNFRNADLKDYRYLHFATHADLPGKIQGIKEPFIILGQVENRGNDDGFLTLSEVLELKLNADLVVLSACSTGKGKMTEGEGVANFARAFQHAGARSVVVSLWEVASDAAVEYMKSFYGHIKSGKGKAEALKLARKEIKVKYPHPFYWSVFILYGEG